MCNSPFSIYYIFFSAVTFLAAPIQSPIPSLPSSTPNLTHSSFQCLQTRHAHHLFDIIPNRRYPPQLSHPKNYPAKIGPRIPHFLQLNATATHKPTRAAIASIATNPMPHSSSNEDVSSSTTCHCNDLRHKFSSTVMDLFESSRLQQESVPHLPPSAYNKMIKQFSEAGKVNEAVRLLREMSLVKCEPNVLCYNTVINALAMANRPREARVVFKEIISMGKVPNVSTFNILVKMNCRMGRFDSAYRVVESMIQSGCKPDSFTYSTLITDLCRSARVEEAWDVMDVMLANKCLPTVHSYTPIVYAYCLEGKIEEANNVMVIMESYNCTPTSVTHNILINALCRKGDFEAVEKIISESDSMGWKPNSNTYNTYMNGLCKWGKPKEAIELFEAMRRNGLETNNFSLSIYIDCLCYDSKIEEAKCLLDRSGVIGYNTVMSRLSVTGSWLEVLKVFTDMLKNGVTPNTRTFNIVINSLCKGGKLSKAKCMFNSKRFVANVVSYNTLIHWCYQYGESDEALRLFHRMDVMKIHPDEITYTIMVVGLCKSDKFLEATECLLRSLKGPVDINLVTGLIKNLGEQKRFRKLLKLFVGKNRLFLEGLCQNAELYNICITLDKILGKL